MSASFGIVHVLYYIAGIRFDDSPLGQAYQYLDPELLANKMLESILYLHSQPPGFNIFLGLVLKAFGGNAAIAFNGLYLLFGWGLYIAMFLMMTRLGVSRLLAVLVSTLFMASPSFVLYENWLFYTFPLALILLLSALVLQKLLAGGGAWSAWAFFGLLFLLGAIWSVFHVAYYLVVAVATTAACPRRRKIVGLAAALPVVLILALYCKNYFLFGTFTTSSWFGMNLSRVTTMNVPLPERVELVDSGKLSNLALIPPFTRLSQYPADYLAATDSYTAEAVVQTNKSSGRANFNHAAFIRISDQYLRDALHSLEYQPWAFVKGIARGWVHYFQSSSNYSPLGSNRKRAEFLISIYDYLLYGLLPSQPLPVASTTHIYLFLLLGLPALVAYALLSALRVNSKAPMLTRRQSLVVLYIATSIIYLAIVGNLFESGENNRFRFVTDPLSAVLTGLVLQHCVFRFGLWRRRLHDRLPFMRAVATGFRQG